MQIAGSLACPMQNGQPQGNLFEKAIRVTLFADDLGVRVIFCGFSRITCLHFSRFFCKHIVVLKEEGQHRKIPFVSILIDTFDINIDIYLRLPLYIHGNTFFFNFVIIYLLYFKYYSSVNPCLFKLKSCVSKMTFHLHPFFLSQVLLWHPLTVS